MRKNGCKVGDLIRIKSNAMTVGDDRHGEESIVTNIDSDGTGIKIKNHHFYWWKEIELVSPTPKRRGMPPKVKPEVKSVSVPVIESEDDPIPFL